MPEIAPPVLRLVPIDGIDVQTSRALQLRPEGMNQGHIDRLQEIVELSDKEQREQGLAIREDLFPPIVLFESETTAVVGDGLHRLFAYIEAKREAIQCQVFTVSDPTLSAKVYTAGANHDQLALPRSSAHCRAAYRLIRELFPDLPLYSKGGVAELAKLSKSVVDKYAREEKAKGVVVPYKSEKVRERHRSTPGPPAEDVAKNNPNKAPRTPSPEKTPRELSPDEAKGDDPRDLEIGSIIRDLGLIVGRIDALAGKRGAEYLDIAAIGRTVKNAQELLTSGRFRGWCPRCHEKEPGPCTLCRGSRFITKNQVGKLDDKESKLFETLGR